MMSHSAPAVCSCPRRVSRRYASMNSPTALSEATTKTSMTRCSSSAARRCATWITIFGKKRTGCIWRCSFSNKLYLSCEFICCYSLSSFMRFLIFLQLLYQPATIQHYQVLLQSAIEPICVLEVLSRQK